MIRVRNTRTGKVTVAADGKDAATLIKIEQDRRTGIELSEAERKAEMAEANRVQRAATASVGRRQALA